MLYLKFALADGPRPFTPIHLLDSDVTRQSCARGTGTITIGGDLVGSQAERTPIALTITADRHVHAYSSVKVADAIRIVSRFGRDSRARAAIAIATGDCCGADPCAAGIIGIIKAIATSGRRRNHARLRAMTSAKGGIGNSSVQADVVEAFAEAIIGRAA